MHIHEDGTLGAGWPAGGGTGAQGAVFLDGRGGDCASFCKKIVWPRHVRHEGS